MKDNSKHLDVEEGYSEKKLPENKKRTVHTYRVPYTLQLYVPSEEQWKTHWTVNFVCVCVFFFTEPFHITSEQIISSDRRL